jgi:hypothetical protein
VPAVQPVKAGVTGCDEAVVVVDGGTGPVNETTSVSSGESDLVVPTATHSDALTHETDLSTSLLVPALGLETTDHTMPSHTITNVSSAEPENE